MSKSAKRATETSDMDCENSRSFYLKRKVSSGEESEQEYSGPVQSKRKIKSRRKNGSPGKESAIISEESRDEINELKEILSSLKMRTSAEKAYKEILNILSDPENSIPKRVMGQITSKVTKIHTLLQRSLIYNSNLEGQVLALGAKQTQQMQEAVEKTVERAMQRQPGKPNMTYAERVGVRSGIAALTNTKRNPPNSITITPSDTGVASSSEKTKEAVLKIVSPVAEKLKVKHVKKISGNGILVETAGQKDLATLLEHPKLREAGFVVGVPAKKSPRVIIYDVPRANNDEETMKAIIEQNLDSNTKEMFRRQVRLAFKTGDRKKERCNWVLETSKEVREILIKKERIYIGWNCCRVQDYIVATRCYKCHSFGHTAKYCRNDKEICGHCAEEGHAFKNCPNKNKSPVCHNCKRGGKTSSHSVTDKACPCYTAALNQVLLRTDYGQ